MFEELSNKLGEALKSLKGQNKITNDNIIPALRIVRRGLIEADVNLKVIDSFLLEVKEAALDIEVVRGLTPQQKFIDIVHQKLVAILGEQTEQLILDTYKPTIIMLVGLQGAGKTTAAAKLGLYLKGKGQKVLLVAADTFRPAARDQLTRLGKDNEIDVYYDEQNKSSFDIASQGCEEGKAKGYDTIIIDTAGRLFIDQELMNEARVIRESIQPNEVLLVVDSMIGQEAAELTRSFNEYVGISGAILTKMDGDSRGGAALSIKAVSGKPIKFIGTGEKIEALEVFYPDRIANRILGMGDILTLVDKAQKEVEIEDVVTMQNKFRDASFNYNDFLRQMKLIRSMGSIGGLVKLLPGMNRIDDSTLKAGEKQLKKIEAIIRSMTKEEREHPHLLNKSQRRRVRVAKGTGITEIDVDKVISDFEKMRKMMQGISKGEIGPKADLFRNPKDGIPGLRGKPDKNIKKNMKQMDTKKKKGFFTL